MLLDHSVAMWDAFLEVLLQSGIDTNRLRKHRPVFESSQKQELFKEMKDMHDFARGVRSPHAP